MKSKFLQFLQFSIFFIVLFNSICFARDYPQSAANQETYLTVPFYNDANWVPFAILNEEFTLNNGEQVKLCLYVDANGDKVFGAVNEVTGDQVELHKSGQGGGGITVGQEFSVIDLDTGFVYIIDNGKVKQNAIHVNNAGADSNGFPYLAQITDTSLVDEFRSHTAEINQQFRASAENHFNPQANPSQGSSSSVGSVVGSIEPLVELNQLPVLKNEGWQFPYPALYLNLDQTRLDIGGPTYLTDSADNFIGLLTDLKYDQDAINDIVNFIQELKNKVKLLTSTFKGSAWLDKDPNLLQARLSRQELYAYEKGVQIRQMILRIIGIALILVAFIIFVLGLIEAVGMSTRFTLKVLTGGALTAPESITLFGFNKAFIMTVFTLVVAGVICLSPTIQNFLMSCLEYIFNFIKGLFEKQKPIAY